MSIDVKMDEFLEIERKYNLYQDTIEGVNYWVYARMHIWYASVLKDCINLGVVHYTDKKDFKEQVKTYIKLIINAIKAKRIKKSDICLINHSRRVFQKEYYECVYTDDIAQKLPENIVLEFPYPMTHLEPVRTQNLFYMDEIILKKIMGAVTYRLFYSSFQI